MATNVIDPVTGETKTFKNSDDAIKYFQERAAELAKANAELLASTNGGDRGAFKVVVTRYSKQNQKSGPNKGNPHPKAGQSKGTFSVFSCGSQFGIAFALDQWDEIKAKTAEIDKFVEANRKDLRTMKEILNRGDQ